MKWCDYRRTGELDVRLVVDPLHGPGRLEPLRTAILRIAPTARIEVGESWFSALLLSMRGRAADLLVLDLNHYRPVTPPLLVHLRQLAQHDAVRVLGNIGHPDPGLPCAVQAWSELDDVLQRWFAARSSRGAPGHEPGTGVTRA
jgi:hypothetical protein